MPGGEAGWSHAGRMALNVLITGCSSGFGRLTSATLAGRGHRVFAGMRDVQGRNAAVAEALRSAEYPDGGAVEPIELDVGSDASVESSVGWALEAAGGCIDVVVNNAAIGAHGLLEGFTSDQLARVFNVNVGGLQRINRAVLPAMRARGEGLIIHVGSTLGRVVLPAMGLYCASKFAVEAIVEGYHRELAPLGVEAVLVQPGAFPTNIAVVALQPADPRGGYGVTGGLPQRMREDTAAIVSGPTAPNPQAVADVIAGLIAMPAGRRPLRTVIDAQPEGARAINEVCAKVQASALEGLGLAHLLAPEGR